MKVKVKSFSHVQLFATLCSPPGSSVHGIFQARVLEWVAIPFSDIIQEVLLKIIPKKKKCKKAKWLSEEFSALPIAEKRREMEKQRRKEKINPSECRIAKNSKERQESLPN